MSTIPGLSPVFGRLRTEIIALIARSMDLNMLCALREASSELAVRIPAQF
jgi:hypothetical protein